MSVNEEMPYSGNISNGQQGAMFFPAKESQTVKKEEEKSMFKNKCTILFISEFNNKHLLSDFIVFIIQH